MFRSSSIYLSLILLALSWLSLDLDVLLSFYVCFFVVVCFATVSHLICLFSLFFIEKVSAFYMLAHFMCILLYLSFFFRHHHCRSYFFFSFPIEFVSQFKLTWIYVGACSIAKQITCVLFGCESKVAIDAIQWNNMNRNR